MITGAPFAIPLAQSRWRSSSPFITGILMSQSTKSTVLSLSKDSASSPSDAVRTSWSWMPATRRACSIIFRMTDESSTISTRKLSTAHSLRLSYQEGHNLLAHLPRRERLADVAACARREGLCHVGLATLGSNHDHGHAFSVAVHGAALEKFQSIHLGHVDIAENQIQSVIFEEQPKPHSHAGFKDLCDLNVRHVEGAFHHLPHGGGIVDDQKADAAHEAANISRPDNGGLSFSSSVIGCGGPGL